MDRSIFRSAAVERLSSPERLDQPVKITTAFGWAALVALLVLVAAGGIASVVIIAPEKVAGEGVVISPSGLREVVFPSAGRLAEIGPRTGDRVAQGSLVARIDQPELRRSLDEAQKSIQDLMAARRHVAEFQQQARQAQATLDAKRQRDLEFGRSLIEQRLQFLRERAAIDTDLGSKRLVTRAQVVDTKVATGTAEEELAATERQANEIALATINTQIHNQRELLDLDLKIDAARRQAELIAARLQQSEQVLSPAEGTVIEYKHDVGELVQQGAALLTLLPTDPNAPPDATGLSMPLQVVLFVPGTEGKKIAPGMTVEIVPSVVQRSEYGFIFARVTRVAAMPSTTEGMLHVLKNQQLVNALSAGGAPFEVEVALLRSPATANALQWSSGQGPAIVISPGTLAHGQVWIRQLRLIEFAIPATRRLFGHAA